MPFLRTILVVDGDASMRQTLREQLTHDAAFAVVEADCAREAEILLFSGDVRFAAVIMDAVLPDGDGHVLCDRLRAKGLSMPVILMNGSNRGFGGPPSTSNPNAPGQTIVIAKPFRLSELMARLRAQFEAQAKIEADVYQPASIRIGPFAFSPEDKALRDDAANLRIRLTEKEVAILSFLHRMNERAVPRRELLTEVWGYNPDVTTHTLETHIYRLRRKLEANPAHASLLVTEAGGYRLATPSADGPG